MSQALRKYAMPCDGPASCSGRGTCDLTRGVCECPLGFTGAHCEEATLSACMLGDHLIPVRAWVLHALEGGAGRTRWSGTPRAIGPVPCRCLLQLVSEPFVLRRSELANLRDDPLVRCVHLPPRLTLAETAKCASLAALHRVDGVLRERACPMEDIVERVRSGAADLLETQS